MIQRARMLKKDSIDYDHEENRHMCEGCSGLYAGGRILTGYKCTSYLTAPSMYVRANECPRNPRARRPGFVKVHVGQGKTKAGGNR